MLSTFDCTDLLQRDQHTPRQHLVIILSLPYKREHIKQHVTNANIALEPRRAPRSVCAAAALFVSLDDLVTNTLGAGPVSPQLLLKVHGRASAGPFEGIQRLEGFSGFVLAVGSEPPTSLHGKHLLFPQHPSCIWPLFHTSLPQTPCDPGATLQELCILDTKHRQLLS